MLSTRDESYKRLVNSCNLGEAQSMILTSIEVNELISRQDISEHTGYTINNVCGRVAELLEYGLIIEDRESGGRGLLRIRNPEDKVKKPILTEAKLTSLNKKIIEIMSIATEKQKTDLKELVARL